MAQRLAECSPAPVIDGVRAAREKIVVRSDEDWQEILRERGASKAETRRIVETVLAEAALGRDAHLANGLNVWNGKVAQEAVARDLSYSFTPVSDALAA